MVKPRALVGIGLGGPEPDPRTREVKFDTNVNNKTARRTYEQLRRLVYLWRYHL